MSRLLEALRQVDPRAPHAAVPKTPPPPGLVPPRAPSILEGDAMPSRALAACSLIDGRVAAAPIGPATFVTPSTPGSVHTQVLATPLAEAAEDESNDANRPIESMDRLSAILSRETFGDLNGTFGPSHSVLCDEGSATFRVEPQVSIETPARPAPLVLPETPRQPVRSPTPAPPHSPPPLVAAVVPSTAEEQTAQRLLERLPASGSAVVAVLGADATDVLPTVHRLRDAVSRRTRQDVHCMEFMEDGPGKGRGAIAAWRAQHRLTLVGGLASGADWLADCDGVVLVVRLGHTRWRTAQRALRAVRSCGGRAIGCIVRSDD